MLAWIPHNCLFLKHMACHVPIHQISERRYYLRSHVDKEKVKRKLLISWKKCGISSKVEETLSVLENIVTQNDCLISTIQYLIKKFDQCYISTFTPSRMKTFTSLLIDMKTFSVKVIEWPIFFDSFEVAIDNSTNLNDSRKIPNLQNSSTDPTLQSKWAHSLTSRKNPVFCI